MTNLFNFIIFTSVISQRQKKYREYQKMMELPSFLKLSKFKNGTHALHYIRPGGAIIIDSPPFKYNDPVLVEMGGHQFGKCNIIADMKGQLSIFGR